MSKVDEKMSNYYSIRSVSKRILFSEEGGGRGWSFDQYPN